MNQTDPSFCARPLALLAAAVLAQATAACGSDVSGTGGGTTGTTGTGGGAACKLDPPGKSFTFHVINTSKQMRHLAFGCGGTLPMNLETSTGKLSIGPGAVNTCEFTCDELYAGTAGPACSDCGSGLGADLGPGVTADIKWDRRVYVAYTPDPKCTPVMQGASCALGHAVAPASVQKGVLTVCSDPTAGQVGFCSTAGSIPVSFEVDTTQNQATIMIP